MLDLTFTEQDREWLRSKYSKLEPINSKPVRITGVLEFDMLYEPLNKRIQDHYSVEIIMAPSDTSSLPQVKETGNRIPKEARRHINPVGQTCCLGSSFLEEKWFPNGFQFSIFIEEVVIPHFYAQSYFEKYKKWPWGELDHGLMGLLESYPEIEGEMSRDKLKKILISLSKHKEWTMCLEYLKRASDVKGHWGCVHDPKMKFRLCHPMAFRGLSKLKKDIQRVGGLNSL